MDYLKIGFEQKLFRIKFSMVNSLDALSTFPRGGARGLQILSLLKFYNLLEWESPYNPQQGNPIERVMRDLGDKFRLLFNNPQNQAIDHSSRDGLVQKVIVTLNNTRKIHGYTPSEILSQEPYIPLRKIKILPHVRTPTEKIKKEFGSMVINTQSYAPSMAPKKNQGKYKFDSEGFVHIWTDAATRGRSDS